VRHIQAQEEARWKRKERENEQVKQTRKRKHENEAREKKVPNRLESAGRHQLHDVQSKFVDALGKLD
jgi:hypothetical protein